ncbi:MAG: hypothetical protein JSW39_15690 [Desulfobacterales bacterium]|nr:MAG: hypothetical protein JSW39_15690 [Desulfobacterales bacterium]
MEINFVDADTKDFDPELYIQILIAITKADRFNGAPEIRYVQNQAERLSLDFAKFWKTTDKTFAIEGSKVSRQTALVVLKDCIMLASLDKNFSLAEREKVYGYAEKLDIPRSDVDYLEKWLKAYTQLHEKWNSFVAASD